MSITVYFIQVSLEQPAEHNIYRHERSTSCAATRSSLSTLSLFCLRCCNLLEISDKDNRVFTVCLNQVRQNSIASGFSSKNSKFQQKKKTLSWKQARKRQEAGAACTYREKFRKQPDLSNMNHRWVEKYRPGL